MVLWVILCAATAVADESEARAVLEEAELTNHRFHWLSAEDRQLDTLLDQLDKLQRKVLQTREAVSARATANDNFRRELEGWRNKLEQQKEAQNPQQFGNKTQEDLVKEIDEARKSIDKLIKRYQRPTDFAADPGVRQLVIESNNARNRLAIVLLRTERQLNRVEDHQESLLADARISQALATLGLRHHLGHGGNLGRHRRTLQRARQLVFTDDVPLYLENEKLRVTAILNRSAVATFSVEEATEGVDFLPHSLALRAGVSIDAKTPQVTIRIGDSQFQVWQVTIEQLQLGGHLFENLPVHVLPPEAENQGAQLAKLTLTRFRQVRIEPQWLQLRLRRY